MSWSRACVVTLVVCALSTVACSGSTPEAAPLLAASPTSSTTSTGPSPTPTRTSSPSPSPTGPKKHEYLTVDDIQVVSSQVAIVAYEKCVASRANETCRSHLARTTDLGESWEEIGPRRPTRYSLFNHPRFLDEDRGWVAVTDCTGGWARIYRTTDGGATWRHVAVQSPTCNAGAGINPIPVDGQVGYYTWAEPTGSFVKLSRSADGGATFGPGTELPVGGLSQPPVFTSSTSGWVTGGSGSVSIEHTVDGGGSWHGERLAPPSCCVHDASAPYAPMFDATTGIVPVIAQDHRMWHVRFDLSNDSGSTWRGGPSVEIAGRYAPSVGVVDATTWWVASRGHTVLRTTDGGATWTTTRGPDDMEITEIEPIDSERAWLRASGGEHSWLFLTIDGGKTWKRVHPDRLPFTTVATLPHAIVHLFGGPDGSLYATGAQGRHEWLSRIDPRTGEVKATAKLEGALVEPDSTAVFADSVWFAGQSPFDPRASTILTRLDSATLRVTDRISMAAPPTAVAATPSGVWVGAGKTITLFDGQGDPLREVDIGGRVTHLAVDPTGTRLYVATSTPRAHTRHMVFQERDAASGALLVGGAHMPDMGFGGPSAIAATTDGVWVTNPTGMMAELQLFRADDLTPVGTVERPGVGYYTGVNSMSETVAGNELWIFDLAAALTCADPETGQVIERIGPHPSKTGINDVVEVDGTIYLANWRSIQRLDPASRCLSSSA